MSSKASRAGLDYGDRFIWRLNREFSHDETCRQIAADRKLGRECAEMFKSYVDPAVSERLYRERKEWIERYRAKAVVAIDGFQAAADLYRHREPQTAAFCHEKATELMVDLAASGELFDVRRHGRFRDHGILYSIRQALEKKLGPITWETTANLVNAAQRALANQNEETLSAEAADAQEEVTADKLRMDLTRFLERNPHFGTPR